MTAHAWGHASDNRTPPNARRARPRGPSASRAPETDRSALETLSRADRSFEPVPRRRERADPPISISAAGVVGKVEVQHDAALAGPSEVRSFDRIEEIAPSAKGFPAVGLVPEGEEHAPAVALDPEQGQLRTKRLFEPARASERNECDHVICSRGNGSRSRIAHLVEIDGEPQ